MKKFFYVILAAAMLICFSACTATSNNESTVAPSSQANEQASSEETPASSENTDEASSAQEGAKVLVVYFSWSGNTEAVANEIIEQTGADSFEIQPATPYTSDYNTLLGVAQREKGTRPEIVGDIENIAQYDTIILGYPNWWADMPMVVYTFLDKYDLSGKTIAPFVTSGGSGFSNTLATIKSMEPNADVTDGLSLSSSAAKSSSDEVEKWLSDIGVN